jgi:hypothetical protein
MKPKHSARKDAGHNLPELSPTTKSNSPSELLELPVQEKHYTPAELAKTWHVDPDTVRDWAKAMGGCLVIDRPEQLHKRGYKSIRIPESTAAKIYSAHFEAAA